MVFLLLAFPAFVFRLVLCSKPGVLIWSRVLHSPQHGTPRLSAMEVPYKALKPSPKEPLSSSVQQPICNVRRSAAADSRASAKIRSLLVQ
jgi:hypothetical protein